MELIQYAMLEIKGECMFLLLILTLLLLTNPFRILTFFFLLCSFSSFLVTRKLLPIAKMKMILLVGRRSSSIIKFGNKWMN